MTPSIVSVFQATDPKTGVPLGIAEVAACGQVAVRAARNLFPQGTKLVLEGFEVDGIFKYLEIR
jgi:hypothetical protein